MSGAGGGTSSAEQEERELRDAFRVFDKHNRGYICASDLRAVLQCLGEDLSEEESKFYGLRCQINKRFTLNDRY